LAGLSFPPFYTAILLILIFAIKLDVLPVTGVGEPGDWASRIKHLILPSFSLGLLMMSYITRVTRSSVLEVMGMDYVRTAEAKGLRKNRVIVKHIFKNALIPLVTVIGLYVGILIGSSVMTEIVFNRPGLGSLLVGAMMDRDYITITSVMTVYSIIVIIVNLVTDLCYGFIDPRITYD
jgi:glutathione transport system permease protein